MSQQTPTEIRILHLEIRLKELENENIKLKAGRREARDKFQRMIGFFFLGIAALWSLATFTMLCTVVLWPELLEVLDQFIVGFGALAAGMFLGSAAQKFLDNLLAD